MGDKEKVITLEDRIPKLKQQRRHKANRRLILYISIFFLLILVFVYFQSPLSKVGTVSVSGNHFVGKDQVIKAGGITGDSGFWDARSATIAQKIEKVDEIQSADVHKHFPNRITVNVEEYKRVAYLQADGHYYPILENGARLSALGSRKIPVNAPVLVNWKEKKTLSKMAAQIQKLPRPLNERISEISFTPTDNFPEGVTVYMNDGFEVRALIDDFASDMKKYPQIVSELDPETKGVIHMRVSTYFSEYSNKKKSSNKKKN